MAAGDGDRDGLGTARTKGRSQAEPLGHPGVTGLFIMQKVLLGDQHPELDGGGLGTASLPPPAR